MSAALEDANSSPRSHRPVECSGLVVTQTPSSSPLEKTSGPFLSDAWDRADVAKGPPGLGSGPRSETGGDARTKRGVDTQLKMRLGVGANFGSGTEGTGSGLPKLEDVSETIDEPPEIPIRKSPRQRDPIFWTELELRRLSNLVASCIHSGRYVGRSKVARDERRQMRIWIDAMKLKAMRILHRAETLASSKASSAGGFSVFGAFSNNPIPMSVKWPGIDPTITDPVALGEEYVRLVEDYYAVLALEEEQATAEPGEEEEQDQLLEAAKVVDGEGDIMNEDVDSQEDRGDQGDEKGDWEKEDDMAYRQAIQRQRDTEANDSNIDDTRKKLLNDGPLSGGIRRRKGPNDGSESAEKTALNRDETLTSKERMVHEDLTANLVDLVGQLRESVTANQQKLDDDKHVLDETEKSVDSNLSSIGAQSKRLHRFAQYSANSTLWVYIAIAFIVLIFLIVLLILV